MHWSVWCGMLLLISCRRGEAPRQALAPAEASSALLQQAGEARAELGVNYTWAADQRIITSDTARLQGAFQHVRYFVMSEKDYAGGTPRSTSLQPCTDFANPWSCPEASLRQHLVRVLRLRQLFPTGYIWLAPEVLANRSWPCKGWTVDELGPDPEAAGYAWAQAALATFGPLGNVILAMTNEEWCAAPGRVAAYNAWRKGVVRAHRENPSCALALGARHVRERRWDGTVMPDRVTDVAPAIWAYVDSVGGWADYHAHGIEGDRFLPHHRAHEATDFQDFFAWSAWLDERYPRIRKSVGEIAYTTSAPGVVATPEQQLADWPTYRRLIKALATEADLVFLYQVEDHQQPEGAFSGSGIYPTLVPKVRELREALQSP